MACLFVKLAVTGHGNNGCPPDWLPSPAAERCVPASADACCPSDSSRSKPHSLPNSTPRKNEASASSPISPHQLRILHGPCLAVLEPGFQGPARPLQPAPIPVSDAHAPVKLPNRGTAPHGSTRPIPAPACVYSVCHPMRRQGEIYGLCGLSTVLRTSIPLFVHNTPCIILIPRPRPLSFVHLPMSVERWPACLIGQDPGVRVVDLRRRSLTCAKWREVTAEPGHHNLLHAATR